MFVSAFASILFFLGEPLPTPMPRIVVAKDGKRFQVADSAQPFVIWGVNYDHDENRRLIEDYWTKEWSRIEEDFREIKALGANVVRIHLQVGKFLDSPTDANAANLNQLSKLLSLAEKNHLYLDLTGLGCYHKKDVPAWYDALSEAERWAAQATFWTAIARQVAENPVVFCFDLMNEPVVPGGKRKPGDWLGPAFGDKHFVQVISLDQASRPRPEIARRWIETLGSAIRKVDSKTLITVGMVDWSLDRPGLTSGFVPALVSERLDFLAVHLYPERGKFDAARQTLRGFSIGKPIVVEETFPLRCGPVELLEFMEASDAEVAGWISFYWGKTPEEMRKPTTIAEALTCQWLEAFAARAKRLASQKGKSR